MNKILRIVFSLAFFLLLFPNGMYSCGPFFPYAVFTYKYHPDFPLKSYAIGVMGIPQPTYARSYLVVAYRFFSGVPLNSGEQEAAVELWNYRIAGWYGPDSKSRAMQEWLEARKLVSGVQKQDEIRVQRNLSDYNVYTNCYDDAFQTAATLLKTHIKRYGASNPNVRDWLNAQDIVFAYCGGPSPTGHQQDIGGGVTVISLPVVKQAPANAPAWLRADRAYQMAAMNFYGGSFDAARQQFEQIAADPTSPWHKMAPYLAARAIIRKATLTADPFDMADLTEAESRLNRILKDPKLRAIHGKARTLRGFVEFRLHPAQAEHEMARGLFRPSSDAVFGEELDDYTQLLDKFLGWTSWSDKSEEESRQTKEFLANNGGIQQLRRDPLTDWILTFQSSSVDDHHHAVARWQATRSLLWLIAALAHATVADPHLPELQRAASQVPSDSPGYLAVQFHRLRLMADSGQPEMVRNDLDAILTTSAEMPLSARNQFLALRMRLAANAQEMRQYALRHPVGVSDDDTFGEISPDYDEGKKKSDDLSGLNQYTPKTMFDRDFGNVWSRGLPLSLSATIVADSSLPENLRRQLALATFARAVVLSNDVVGKGAAAQLSSLFPEVDPYLQSYQAAIDAEGAHFSGIFTVLHFPGMKPYLASGLGRNTPTEIKGDWYLTDQPIHRIDDYRDNWWCPLSDGIGLDEPAYLHQYDTPDGSSTNKPEYPMFLKDEEQAQAAAEWKAVQAASPAANYLGREVLAWAQSHPDDPRVPEALHLAVRAARYGCNNKQTAHITLACFRYLHQHYPDSEWTKKTPIWAAN